MEVWDFTPPADNGEGDEIRSGMSTPAAGDESVQEMEMLDVVEDVSGKDSMMNAYGRTMGWKT